MSLFRLSNQIFSRVCSKVKSRLCSNIFSNNSLDSFFYEKCQQSDITIWNNTFPASHHRFAESPLFHPLSDASRQSVQLQ